MGLENSNKINSGMQQMFSSDYVGSFWFVKVRVYINISEVLHFKGNLSLFFPFSSKTNLYKKDSTLEY